MFINYRHVHFVGIGGIGMSALAKWFLHEGIAVSGSDVNVGSITEDLVHRGARVFHGHASQNVDEDVDLLIYTPAVHTDNVERVAAQERGVREASNFEFLGELSKSFSTIVVSGTNGKSTTTAMLGLILEAAGYDPTVIVGSLVPAFPDGNLRVGKGRFFVVEGCEYRANMLHLEPEMIVLTNIEEDHLDYYRDLAHIQATFQQFVDKLHGQGMVIFNADDVGTQALRIVRGVGYGVATLPPLPDLSPEALAKVEGGLGGVGVHTNESTYLIHDRKAQPGAQHADIFRKEVHEVLLGRLNLNIPGSFNMMNALAAASSAMELGVPFETCARALASFRGLWRRFERVGVWKGADVISDYGHHPSGIKQTIEAAREFFPGRRIVLCYQPHQHDRTKKLFEGFVVTLPLADLLILTEIYDVAGRNEDHDVSSQDLVDAIKKNNLVKDVRFAADQQAAENLLREVVKPADVLIIMGAGDIDELARKLV